MTGKPDQRFMLGSGGNADYLVIAAQGGFYLGIKPILIGTSPTSMLMACRLRSMRDPAFTHPEIAENVTQFVKKGTLAEAWPKIPFNEVNGVRASSIFGLPIDLAAAGIDMTSHTPPDCPACKALLALIDTPEKHQGLLAMLEPLVPENRVVSYQAIVDYVFAGYRKGLTPPVGDQQPTAPTMPATAEVVTFKPKGKGSAAPPL
jgi:hypothetical protein